MSYIQWALENMSPGDIMSDKNTAGANGWKDGIIAGYQSIRGRGVTPTIPSRPATMPSNLRTAQDVYDHYYRLGFETGKENAR